eukprot:TRINITY_DN244_c1_g1_i1.p1 TRINITY_DN244_c1_g1~~TRINITY_DN244_c1_g1_i1.p1  ORF type:complete len:1118 (+),score=626.38 TRINITY_DN244_c1_g1_i1:92-3445(+)
MGKKKDAENIRVVIRVRPMNQKERETCKEAVHLDLGMGSISVAHAVGDPDRFTFDAVYNNTFSQKQIFNNEVKPLVQSVLDGYNATVFAYGQSGSGKTFTMTGVPGTENAGLMPNALNAIFAGVKELETTQKTYRIKISYLELYNGKARDLFAKKQTNLEIKQNASKNFYVKGLDAFEVTTTTECLRLFDEGTERRKTASTDLNEHSSRSHAIFTVYIVSTDHEADAGAPVIMTSKLNLCDLAGSERQSKTNTTGDTLREGCNINLSLSALGTVIDTLVKGKGHVPYRSSPLTMLLKDSLGGNSKTVMFANVGPADMNTAETISTLRFADRAKQIENKPVKNLDPKDQMIADLKEQIEDLKRRLARGGGGDLEKEQELENRIEVIQVERDQERQEWERERLDLESQIRMLEKQVKELEEMVQKMSKDLEDAGDLKKVGGTQVDELKDQLEELKKMSMEFFQRILPENLIAEVASKQIGAQQESGVVWDRTKIQDMHDAFLKWWKEERQRGVSEEETQERVAAATADLQGKLKQVEEQHAQQQKMHDEEFQIEKKRLADEMETLATTKASLENAEGQCTRLKEKIRKDHEKFKTKLAAVQQQVEEKAGEVRAKEEELSDLRAQLSRAKEDADGALEKARTEAERAAAERDLEAKKQLSALQQKLDAELEAKEEEKAELAQKIKRLEISRLHNQMRPGKGEAEASGSDAANDGFVDEGDHTLSTGELAHLDKLGGDGDGGVLSELHTQLRIQLALQRLRHQQQKQLDGLVGRYHRAAQDARGKVSEEKMRKALDQLAQERQEQYDALRTQKEKEQAKIVKNVNKMKSQFEEEVRRLNDDKQELEAELREVNETNAALSKELESLLEQVQTLHGELEEKAAEVQRLDRRRERELVQAQRDAQAAEDDIHRLREQITKHKELERQYQDLRKEHELTKVSLRDQRGQVEAQRARLRNMEEMWQTEKQRNETLRQQAEEAQARIDKTEEHYQEVVRAHGERMSKLLHERVEEERQQHAEEMREQQHREKLVREKLKKAKAREQKAKQKFDEMVLENEQLQTQFEECKVAALRLYQEKEGGGRQVDDHRRNIDDLVRREKQLRIEQDLAFTGRPPSREMRGSGY